MNILVISAHPDDETIGMGGTISKLRKEGHKLYWLILTRAFSPKWSKEIVAEKLKEVGRVEKFFRFERVFHSKFKAASLGAYPQHQIIDEISKIIGLVKPEVVYMPPLLDIHDDHQITANAVLIAVRPQYKSSVQKLISYQIPVTSAFSSLKGDLQKYSSYVDISKYIDSKLTAMSFYKTELMNPPHPRSLDSIKIFARERGIVSGFEFAEVFSIVIEKES